MKSKLTEVDVSFYAENVGVHRRVQPPAAVNPRPQRFFANNGRGGLLETLAAVPVRLISTGFRLFFSALGFGCTVVSFVVNRVLPGAVLERLQGRLNRGMPPASQAAITLVQ